MEEKRLVRASVRARRAARTEAAQAGTAAAGARSDADAFATELAALTAALGARRVSCFVSVRGEPDTSGYLTWALAHGVEILLPRVRPDGRLEWVVHRAGAFAPGAFGIPEPTGPASAESDAEGTDLMLIPAAAVDRSGQRLGWGRGFFDRELARLPRRESGTRPAVFAVVHEDEVLDRLPAEAHDVPVDGAVTEERIHRFG